MRERETVTTRFAPLPRMPLADGAIQAIKNMITSGQLRPGQKLPPEREMATQLGLSRNSLREAIRALVLMNILESRQGDGTYVTSLEPSLLMEPMSFVISLDSAIMRHLFEVRNIFEPEAAALAAERIHNDEVEALQECVAAMGRCVHKPDVFLQGDVEFHGLIAKAARNPLLNSVMASLGSLSLSSRIQTARDVTIRQTASADHDAILQAIRDRDPHASRTAMRVHLLHVEPPS